MNSSRLPAMEEECSVLELKTNRQRGGEEEERKEETTNGEEKKKKKP